MTGEDEDVTSVAARKFEKQGHEIAAGD